MESGTAAGVSSWCILMQGGRDLGSVLLKLIGSGKQPGAALRFAGLVQADAFALKIFGGIVMVIVKPLDCIIVVGVHYINYDVDHLISLEFDYSRFRNQTSYPTLNQF